MHGVEMKNDVFSHSSDQNLTPLKKLSHDSEITTKIHAYFTMSYASNLCTVDSRFNFFLRIRWGSSLELHAKC